MRDLVRGATGRDAGDVSNIAALLAPEGTDDPRELARAAVLAFALVDLHACARGLGAKE